jgi:hypothetical protein
MQSAPTPTLTAENEAWYQSGEPVSFGGNLYFPAGAVTHFVRDEMVRAGVVGNTPVYVRTTQEPGSIIYVPLAGGLMRPYERRRSGELAGTVGSTAPSFPITLPSEEAPAGAAGIQAPAPPTGVPVGTTGTVAAGTTASASVPAPVGTSGTAAAAAATSGAAAAGPVGTSGPLVFRSVVTPTRIQTARRPVGLNNVFVEFQNARWFASGSAVEYNPDRFTKIGERNGFPVYQENGQSDVIYLSLLPGAPGLMTPYKSR